MATKSFHVCDKCASPILNHKDGVTLALDLSMLSDPSLPAPPEGVHEVAARSNVRAGTYHKSCLSSMVQTADLYDEDVPF